MKLEKFKEAEEIKDRIFQLQLFMQWIDTMNFKPIDLSISLNSIRTKFLPGNFSLLPLDEPCEQSKKLNNADLQCIINAIDQQIKKLEQEFEAL